MYIITIERSCLVISFILQVLYFWIDSLMFIYVLLLNIILIASWFFRKHCKYVHVIIISMLVYMVYTVYLLKITSTLYARCVYLKFSIYILRWFSVSGGKRKRHDDWPFLPWTMTVIGNAVIIQNSSLFIVGSNRGKKEKR